VNPETWLFRREAAEKDLLKDLKWIILFWGASEAIFYSIFGVRLGGDSGRYIQAARAILDGLPLTREQWSYFSYEALMAAIFHFGGGPRGVVAFQCLLALGGAIFLYYGARKMFSRPAGVTAALLYLGNLSVQRWNFYVLTETLATTALIAVFAAVVLLRQGTGWGVALIPAALVLSLTRPETSPFLLSVAVYCFICRKRRMALWGIGLLALWLGVWLLRPGSPETLRILEHWQKGTYIWGYPGIGPPDLHGVILSSSSTASAIGHFLWHDPGWTLKILALRFYYFILSVRPFYSQVHNLAVMGGMVAVYGLALWGTWQGSRKEVFLIWLLFLTQAALSALTWSDWDNRWLDRVLPLLTILSAGGAVSFWNHFGKIVKHVPGTHC
jgi:hypothetical protein